MFDNILTVIFLSSSMLFLLSSMFVLPYTLGKKFDRIMQQHNLFIPNSFGFMPPHIYRSNMYAVNIAIFPNPKKYPKLMKYYKRWFGNFWFREHASIWDKIQAWYLTSMLGIMILSLIIAMITYVVQYTITLF